MDPREAEDIKKRWQEYTELHKQVLHDPDNPEGVITHLEPDILECEVKWALGRVTMNKASGRDGILIELFQVLKDEVVKVLHSIHTQNKTQTDRLGLQSKYPKTSLVMTLILLPNCFSACEAAGCYSSYGPPLPSSSFCPGIFVQCGKPHREC